MKQLKAKIIQLKPRKRQKIQISPNSKFVSIKAIIKA